MASPYRASISFSRLLEDCWGILKQTREPIFPMGSRAAPSPVVYVFPDVNPNFGYWWDFWEEVVAPTLVSLAASPPPYQGGWANLNSEATVEAALRSALEASNWADKVDYSS